jgi:rare lipoprotein A (peptidoglycan hydrolase)
MRKPIAQALGLALLIGWGQAEAPRAAVPACGRVPARKANRVVTIPRASAHPYQVGTASWYGEDFDGKPTASGEPYDMYDLTAAHPSLPLGTLVKVTNLTNRRAIVVRINDRGPIVPGRIIDVSYGAARALRFDGRGLERVRLDLVSPSRQPITIAMLRQPALDAR